MTASIIVLSAHQAWSAPSCRIFLEEALRAQAPVVTRLTEQEVTDLVKKSKTYQDNRNQDWAQTRRCLCCHTTLPYMMSRGLDAQSRNNFESFKDLSIASMERPESHLWYHADNAGRDSRPTEVVVHAMTLLMYDVSKGTQLQPITLKAVDEILKNLDADGHIHWLDYGLQPFESKKGELWGNSLALLTIEMAKKNSAYNPPADKYDRLKNYVLSNAQQLKPHEMSVLLWAHSMKNTLLSSQQKSQFVQKIKSSQNADGSWNQLAVLGQGQNRADIYSTAIALIGLVRANQHGPEVDKAAKWLAAAQQTGNLLRMGEGATLWPSTSMNRNNSILNDRFASDFATSYTSLALQMYRAQVLLR